MLKQGDWRRSISTLPFSDLDSEESRSFEEPFYEEKVFSALSSLCGDKALGSEGFTMAFWQFYSDIIKNEVMSFFTKFHDSSL